MYTRGKTVFFGVPVSRGRGHHCTIEVTNGETLPEVHVHSFPPAKAIVTLGNVSSRSKLLEASLGITQRPLGHDIVYPEVLGRCNIVSQGPRISRVNFQAS
ncbi:hypothetical protein M8J75_010927 [Diaphorina citri]|nr:hypothetical protein M8J75_010927 [Diaphorina citri]